MAAEWRMIMAINFKDSETHVNLMRAFAGESQARNRYTFGADLAKKQKMQAVSEVFLFTANQEKEHAEIFYKHLSEMSGETITIDAGYPVEVYNEMEKVLEAAKHNEYEEYETVYQSFGDKATEEGFPKIAASFYMIAKIEKVHGDRFGKFLEYLKSNQLYVSDVETGWICLNCGHVHYGKSAPKQCPVCEHDQGYFIRVELSPYTTNEIAPKQN